MQSRMHTVKDAIETLTPVWSCGQPHFYIENELNLVRGQTDICLTKDKCTLRKMVAGDDLNTLVTMLMCTCGRH